MTDPISHDEVKHVANLARLRLTDEELEIFTDQLRAVLDHAKDVEALELDKIEPMSHPIPVENVMREDVPDEMLKHSDFFEQAPAVEDGRFLVPKILEEEI
tara:strand:+ start:12809 stop:13111 length:303 start_codon:yes stop_codon:yes gene_type:complete